MATVRKAFASIKSTVNVTRSSRVVQFERSSLVENASQKGSLCLLWFKICRECLFDNSRTDQNRTTAENNMHLEN